MQFYYNKYNIIKKTLGYVFKRKKKAYFLIYYYIRIILAVKFIQIYFLENRKVFPNYFICSMYIGILCETI